MDSLQRLFLFVALVVLILTVVKWVRILRRLNDTIRAAQEKARGNGADADEPQDD